MLLEDTCTPIPSTTREYLPRNASASLSLALQLITFSAVLPGSDRNGWTAGFSTQNDTNNPNFLGQSRQSRKRAHGPKTVQTFKISSGLQQGLGSGVEVYSVWRRSFIVDTRFQGGVGMRKRMHPSSIYLDGVALILFPEAARLSRSISEL